MPNISDAQNVAAKELERLLEKYGAQAGMEVSKLIKQGALNPNGTVLITIGETQIKGMLPGPGSFPLMQRVFLTLKLH